MNKLHLGCGSDILYDYINVDIQNHKGVDKSFNFDKDKYPFNDNSIDYVYSASVIEHLHNRMYCFDELYRICKDGAIIHIIVPFWNTGAAFDDPTHVFPPMSIRQLESIAGSYSRCYPTRETRMRVISKKLQPLPWTKWIPRFIRNRLCNYIPNMVGAIDIKFEVLK